MESRVTPAFEMRSRPLRRGDCRDVPRPCPFVSCKQNLFLDVTRTGRIRLNYPMLEPDQVPESCALDLADQGVTPLGHVAQIFGVTRQYVQMLEQGALEKIRRHLRVLGTAAPIRVEDVH
jgi:hypothetical protein